MEFDQAYFENYEGVIGCDEVGRGPIAGPVNACAVYINQENKSLVKHLSDLGVTDSKKLSSKKRIKILESFGIDPLSISLNKVTKIPTEYGEFLFVVSEKSPEQIDQINILQAALLCMKESSDKLITDNNIVLVDGNKTFESKAKEIQAVVKGDSKSCVIGLASIIAKEFRDKKMEGYEKVFPGYGLGKNAGYPTKVHKEALVSLGITPIHRKTFKGVKELI